MKTIDTRTKRILVRLEAFGLANTPSEAKEMERDFVRKAKGFKKPLKVQVNKEEL